LIYGIGVPPGITPGVLFSTLFLNTGRTFPKIHQIVKNRLTQYMGSASAYNSILKKIDERIGYYLTNHPQIFSFNSPDSGIMEVRDFGSTGVASFAHGTPFLNMKSGNYDIEGNETMINKSYIDKCQKDIIKLANRL
jgi:hypothetical protein